MASSNSRYVAGTDVGNLQIRTDMVTFVGTSMPWSMRRRASEGIQLPT